MESISPRFDSTDKSTRQTNRNYKLFTVIQVLGSSFLMEQKIWSASIPSVRAGQEYLSYGTFFTG